MSNEEFLAYLTELLENVGERELPDDHFDRAVGYPWERPAGSCLVSDGKVADVDDGDRDLVKRYVRDGDRVPLLAYGANASPARLALKLAHLPDGHREALILAGTLEGFDVGVSAQLPVFSSMPGTLVPSPGTALSVAVLFVTLVQFTALWWTELSYKVGALNDVTLTLALADEPVRRVITFVSRYGAFCMDGAPVVMSAIPATDRRHVAMTQRAILDAVARVTIGDDADARNLIRSAYERPAAFMAEHYPTVRAASIPFASDHWEEMPAGGAL
jgi:hypothetical protein